MTHVPATAPDPYASVIVVEYSQHEPIEDKN